MFEWLGNLSLIQQVGGIAGLVALLVGYLLKKYKISDKMKEATDKMMLPESGFSRSAIVSGYNSGVAGTAFFNRIPVLNAFYEKFIEPLIILFMECVVKLVIHWVSLFINRFIIGMRSDNIKVTTDVK